MGLLSPSLPCLFLLLAGCVHQGTAVPKTRLGPTEAWLIHQGDADAPLPVVHVEDSAGERLLRTPSLEVDPSDPDLDLLARRMKATMDARKGVGIAAPQVGVLRRVAWVQRQDLPEQPFRFYVNPRIEVLGGGQVSGWEGCLSVGAGFGEVDRAETVTVSWDEGDVRRVEQVSGWTARIFQHELDHLDGVLFYDRIPCVPGEPCPPLVAQRPPRNPRPDAGPTEAPVNGTAEQAGGRDGE